MENEKKVTINGHIVSYQQEAKEGIDYLIYYIDPKESEVFFGYALSHGSAFFESQTGRNYQLVHNGAEYKLLKA